MTYNFTTIPVRITTAVGNDIWISSIPTYRSWVGFGWRPKWGWETLVFKGYGDEKEVIYTAQDTFDTDKVILLHVELYAKIVENGYKWIDKEEDAEC